MTNTETYSDEQLTAYLDGELEASLVNEIQRTIRTDAVLKQRLEGLEINKSQLVSAMDNLLETAPQMPKLPSEPPLLETRDNLRPRLANIRSMAAGFALLVFGGMAGFYLSQPQTDGWRDYVAAYHLLYVNSTLSSVRTDESIQRTELSRISEAIAKPVALEKLNNVTGLDYKRAQILGFRGKPLAQMTFLSSTGTPIALCIIRTDTMGNVRPEITELEGMASSSWTNDGYAFLLIGGKDTKLIKDTADIFSKIL